METQPQLLLLQKTMLVAEGVGRTLHPDVNMWELARPLIEDWMRESMGPEARVAEVVADTLGVVERLPGLIARLDDTVGDMAQGGLRLHPDTVRALAAVRAERRRRTWPVWLLIALLGIVIGLLID
jgi:ubiquinone biosynthesis protein